VAHEEFVKQAGTFQPPPELMQLVMNEMAPITRDDFFNNPAHQPVMDAWQGAVLATGFEELANGNVTVRLSSHEQFPDFQVKHGSVVHDFEAVMALNKPLGKLYKGDMEKGPVSLGKPEVMPPPDLGPMREAIEGKVKKQYAGVVNLCVYLNYASGGAEFEKVVSEVLDAAQGKFKSIWIIARGSTAGEADQGGFFLCCAKVAAGLPRTGAWYRIQRLKGGKP
jgi:hypothetical protein